MRMVRLLRLIPGLANPWVPIFRWGAARLGSSLARTAPRLTARRGVLALAAALLAVDHGWSHLTWGALALAAGVFVAANLNPVLFGGPHAQ